MPCVKTEVFRSQVRNRWQSPHRGAFPDEQSWKSRSHADGRQDGPGSTTRFSHLHGRLPCASPHPPRRKTPRPASPLGRKWMVPVLTQTPLRGRLFQLHRFATISRAVSAQAASFSAESNALCLVGEPRTTTIRIPRFLGTNLHREVVLRFLQISRFPADHGEPSRCPNSLLVFTMFFDIFGAMTVNAYEEDCIAPRMSR